MSREPGHVQIPYLLVFNVVFKPFLSWHILGEPYSLSPFEFSAILLGGRKGCHVVITFPPCRFFMFFSLRNPAVGQICAGLISLYDAKAGKPWSMFGRC